MTTRHRKRSHASNRDHRRTKKNLKKRIFDNDQVIEQINRQIKPALDDELPGGGAFYCTPCCKHFENQIAMTKHISSKKHKRIVKSLIRESQDPWDQQRAEAAAGLMPERPPPLGPLSSALDKNGIDSFIWRDVPCAPSSDKQPLEMID